MPVIHDAVEAGVRVAAEEEIAAATDGIRVSEVAVLPVVECHFG
jgi:hypothetical protein